MNSYKYLITVKSIHFTAVLKIRRELVSDWCSVISKFDWLFGNEEGKTTISAIKELSNRFLLRILRVPRSL